MRSSTRRVLVVAWPLALGALVLGACGDDSSGATRSTIDLSQGSTAFVVRPTVPPSSNVVQNPGDVSTVGQEYTLVFGDYPLGVADAFGITVDELVEYNGWASAGEFPPAGTTILIPPGATVAATPTQASQQESTDDSVADAPEAGAEPTTTAPGDTIPEAGDNCAEGTYEIASGDYPLVVAEKFDVTVEALNQANAGTPGYSAFYPGLTIIIPAKADC